jgi:uncharacterized protein YcfJ
MKTTLSITAAAVLAGLGGVAQAQSQDITGRVISSTPVIQQVQVPRQVCSNQPVAVQQPRSGAGAVIGAIAGAALGNAIGSGTGRAVATGIGLVGGAAVGDRVEGGGTMVQNMQSCTTQTYYENRTVGYNVTYEYAGQQYTVQMPYDPGPSIRLQVSPVGSATPQDGYPVAGGEAMSAPAGTPSVPAVVASTTTVYPAYQTYPAYPAYPVYPAYYPSYYPPVGISLGFGFSSRGGHHHGHRGHWR